MVKDIYTLVGERVREERKKAGLTIEQLSESAGISPSFLAYIETKGRKASLETIHKLAHALRISVADLFRDASEPEKNFIYDGSRKFIQLVRDKNPEEVDAFIAMVKAASKAFGKRRRK